jgi:hypothetical protein
MPTTTTWPNGQVLVSSALTPQAVMTLFQNLTLNIMGITPTGPTDPAYSSVRTSWPPAGQPAFTASDNVAFLAARLKTDHQYGQVRDVQVTEGATTASVVQNIVYTRVWEVRWTIYGPNSFDTARLIKDALISAEWTLYQLGSSNLFLSPDDGDPLYVPEEHPVRGQWWPRTDYVALFNEQVNETITTPSVRSVEIEVFDDLGKLADITVVNPNG